MKHYGLSQKIVPLIKLFNKQLECGVVQKEGVSHLFEVQTGMRQIYMISSLLFLILIDYVVRIVNKNHAETHSSEFLPVKKNI